MRWKSEQSRGMGSFCNYRRLVLLLVMVEPGYDKLLSSNFNFRFHFFLFLQLSRLRLEVDCVCHIHQLVCVYPVPLILVVVEIRELLRRLDYPVFNHRVPYGILSDQSSIAWYGNWSLYIGYCVWRITQGRWKFKRFPPWDNGVESWIASLCARPSCNLPFYGSSVSTLKEQVRCSKLFFGLIPSIFRVVRTHYHCFCFKVALCLYFSEDCG